MTSLLFTSIFFLIAITILVAVHEFGHFLVARTLGIRVLRFSIGFGTVIWKYISPKTQTEYVLSALPLGGYVKMLDEEEAPVAAADLPQAFNRQALWVRSAVVVAGPAFNILFAFLVYWLFFMVGDISIKPLVGQVTPKSIAEIAGFKLGDTITTVDKVATDDWEEVLLALISNWSSNDRIPIGVVDVNGNSQNRWLPRVAIDRLSSNPKVFDVLGIKPALPKLPAQIGAVIAESPAAVAGLRAGDVIISVDNQQVSDWNAFVYHVRAHPELVMELQVQRQNTSIALQIKPRSYQEGAKVVGRIGAEVAIPDVTRRFYPGEALHKATLRTAQMLQLMFSGLGKMFTGQSKIVDNVSGPISIANFAGKAASNGFASFLKFLAAISISLGVLNLLPIPILDGGHLLLYAAEGITGKPIPEWYKIQAQRLGIIIIILLMSLALYTDFKFLG
ncbi:hypothetical protein TI04_00455 [Achromatium sp. WMS2]|nr:hypothetical protein TI04_00455 [Achromatium sp. WMS2]